MMTVDEAFRRLKQTLDEGKWMKTEQVTASVKLELMPWSPMETVKLTNGNGEVHVSRLPPETLEAQLANFRIMTMRKAGHEEYLDQLPPPPAPAKGDETEAPKPVTDITKILKRRDGTEIFRMDSLRWSDVIKAAIEAGRALDYADFCGLDIKHVDFRRATLIGAVFNGAILDSCDFGNMNLRDVSFRRACLDACSFQGATLTETCFHSAALDRNHFDGARMEMWLLVGPRPIFTMGPLGDGHRNTTLYLTERGPMVCTGCFYDTLAKFVKRVKSTKSRRDQSRRSYLAAARMMREYAKIWMPKADWGRRYG